MIEAIQIMSAMLTLSINTMEMAQRVSLMIQQAQSEGRDLTDDELAQIRQLRQEAMDRWNAVK